MTTYVMRDGALVDKDRAPPKSVGRSVNVISDIDPFRTQDGTAITSRADLRAYEQANGVRQVGTEWTGSTKPAWWDAHRAREAARGR